MENDLQHLTAVVDETVYEGLVQSLIKCRALIPDRPVTYYKLCDEKQNYQYFAMVMAHSEGTRDL